MRLRIFAALVAFAVCLVLPIAALAQINTPTDVSKLPPDELRAKADQGDVTAQIELAKRFVLALAVVTDAAEALKVYRGMADKGDPYAQYALGVVHSAGIAVTKDEVEAFKWMRKVAEQGFAFGQDALGSMYVNGQGVAKDEAEAARWYRKASEQGLPDSQYVLGWMYETGRGVAKDEAEAVKWYRKAAEQGNKSSQYILGLMYAGGQGVAKDEAEAVKWYRRAAEQGDARAQVNLGGMFEDGQGVAKDEAEAVKWYRKAAEQGEASAQFNLGNMYSQGRGVTKDEGEAVKWYRKAAEQGDADSQLNLGYMHAYGDGTIKNEVEAYKWFLLAGAQGEEIAKKNISKIERILSSSQRAEGQRLAREWKPRQELSPDSTPSPAQIAESKPSGTGSAFAITEDGYFITNEHVVADGGTVRLLTSAGLLEAKVVRVDKANDLALLKVEGRFPALPIAASRGVRLGATVATVGFPNPGLQGFAPKLAKGEVASLSGAQDDARQFQVSIPIQPGNSGGAMVDERGNVVGVIVAKLSQKAALATTGTLAENVNYAIKSGYLLTFLESVPEVASQLSDASTRERPFEDVVQEVEKATALVLVY